MGRLCHSLLALLNWKRQILFAHFPTLSHFPFAHTHTHMKDDTIVLGFKSAAICAVWAHRRALLFFVVCDNCHCNPVQLIKITEFTPAGLRCAAMPFSPCSIFRKRGHVFICNTHGLGQADDTHTHTHTRKLSEFLLSFKSQLHNS